MLLKTVMVSRIEECSSLERTILIITVNGSALRYEFENMSWLVAAQF